MPFLYEYSNNVTLNIVDAHVDLFVFYTDLILICDCLIRFK